MPETVMRTKKLKGLETPLLSLEERRDMLSALKGLTDFRMQNIAMDSGAYAQNFHAFLRGANGLGDHKQLAFLRNYGMEPDGALRDVLHTWLIRSNDSWIWVNQALKCEGAVAERLAITPVFLAPDNKHFVGLAAHLTVNDRLHKHERRVLLTANDPKLTYDRACWLLQSALRLDSASVQVLEPGSVGASNARNLWRWAPSVGLPGNGRSRIPPKKSQLPYNTDYLDSSAGGDTASGLLRECVDRISVLSAELCELKGVRQSQWDASLIKRSWKYLELSPKSD